VKEYEEAKNCYNKALNICLKIYGEQHIKAANVYLCLGKVCYLLDDPEKSRNYYTKALQIYEKLNERSHPNAIEAINILRDTCKISKFKSNYEW